MNSWYIVAENHTKRESGSFLQLEWTQEINLNSEIPVTIEKSKSNIFLRQTKLASSNKIGKVYFSYVSEEMVKCAVSIQFSFYSSHICGLQMLWDIVNLNRQHRRAVRFFPSIDATS